MANKKLADQAAQKARKQKIIVIVGAVLLVGIAAFQIPKLMHRGGAADATPSSSSSSGSGVGTPVTETAPVATAPSATPATKVAAGKTGAVVAGVALPVGAATKSAATGQLAAFTLFEDKDPFVQKVADAQTAAQKASDAYYNTHGTLPPAGAASAGNGTGQAAGAAPGTGTGSGGDAGQAQQPAPIRFATINLDGKPQQVALKGQFPAAAPLFVLVSLKKNQAKIGVAGGSFDASQTVTLTLGKKVTLVNTATGVRYVLKLVYTGAAPEVLASFTTTTGQQGTNGTTGSSAPTTTTDTTTTTTTTTTTGN
jgi:hypothetical protein